MEPGEDITEAARREVLEETGLHFEVTTLLGVETAGTNSYGIHFLVPAQAPILSWA